MTRKIQKVKKLKALVDEIAPDVILYHGVCGWELMTVAAYKKVHKNVKLYVDCHEDFHNTAKTALSKVSYKYIHGYFVKHALPYIDKILYVSEECKEYLTEMYKISESELEYYPLGGLPFDDDIYSKKREEKRQELKLKDNNIMFLHSGKMNAGKKTEELIKAFVKIKNDNFRLVIIGIFQDNVWEKVKPYIESDKRISYLGWKTGEELMDFLCAADMYMQPGTQSATMQNAICCRCGIMLYPYKSHKAYLKGNGYFVSNEEDIKRALQQISENPQAVKKMKLESERIGRDILDYRKLAARIYR